MYETLASVYENQSLHNFVLQILTNYTLMLFCCVIHHQCARMPMRLPITAVATKALPTGPRR